MIGGDNLRKDKGQGSYQRGNEGQKSGYKPC